MRTLTRVHITQHYRQQYVMDVEITHMVISVSSVREDITLTVQLIRILSVKVCSA